MVYYMQFVKQHLLLFLYLVGKTASLKVCGILVFPTLKALIFEQLKNELMKSEPVNVWKQGRI